MMKIRFIFCSAMLLLLQACSTTPAKLTYYDFGALTKHGENQLSCNLPPIYLADIDESSAFNSDLMRYRLLYSNDFQTRAYANSRWVMRPSELLGQRIKMQLAHSSVALLENGMNAQAALQLRLELDDFSQYFSDATHSYAQLQLRASLLRGHTLLAQTTFTQQAGADAPDAPAGARAMRAATDEFIVSLSNWLCRQVPMY